MKMRSLTKGDILLIQNLKNRSYTGNTMSSNSTEYERNQFREIRYKLKDLATYFAHKYTNWGPFEFDYTKANPLTRGGALNAVWSGVYKGANNKQYAAQISFVINTYRAGLDVGFYFGRASSHNKSGEERVRLENNLKKISTDLSDTITQNKELLDAYYDLTDYGFNAYCNNQQIYLNEWLYAIKKTPQQCKIVVTLSPNEDGYIEYSVIDAYLNRVLFLMQCIGDRNKTSYVIPPKTPEQRAKQAERYAQIGAKGEEFIFQQEHNKLRKMGSLDSDYPRHISKESDSYGYDILSKNEYDGEIYIEVKTTTRKKEDYGAKTFFISENEYNFYLKNKEKYRLYRVYAIDNDPHYEELNMDDLKLTPTQYEVSY